MTQSEKLFIILAEELNFSRAAEKAFISQQCLSDHIRRMEESYGTRLFTRKPRIALTQAGEAVLRTLWKIGFMQEVLSSQLAEIRDGAKGSLVVGINSTRAKLLIPSLFDRYRAIYPSVNLSFRIEETTDMEEQLVKGGIDAFVGVNATPRPEFRMIPLMRENVYLAVSGAYMDRYFGDRNTCLAAFREGADLAMFQNLPFTRNLSKSTLTQLVNQHLAERDIRVENVLSISDYDVQIELCRAGHAAAFCPLIILPSVMQSNRLYNDERRIFFFPIRDFRGTLRIDLVHNELVGPDEYPRYATRFFELIGEEVQRYAAFEEDLRSGAVS